MHGKMYGAHTYTRSLREIEEEREREGKRVKRFQKMQNAYCKTHTHTHIQDTLQFQNCILIYCL